MTTNGSRRIKAIFFDLYNTLARFWPPREQVQAQACADFGYTVTPDGIARGYLRADAFMSRENARSQVQRRSPADQLAFFTEYQRLILEGAGVDVPPSVAGQIWGRVRQIPYGMALFADVAETLPRLRASGYVVGVITNMDSNGAQVSRDMGLDALADFVVTSGEVGMGKPHPPIYLTALARANADPSEAVMVGDSVTGDVEGAMAVGITPVFINRYPDTPPDDLRPRASPPSTPSPRSRPSYARDCRGLKHRRSCAGRNPEGRGCAGCPPSLTPLPLARTFAPHHDGHNARSTRGGRHAHPRGK